MYTCTKVLASSVSIVKPCRCSDKLSRSAASDEEGQAKGLQPLPGGDHETGVCMGSCVLVCVHVCVTVLPAHLALRVFASGTALCSLPFLETLMKAV